MLDTGSVGGAWRPLLASFFSGAEGRRLASFVEGRIAGGAAVYPPDPFRALELTPLEETRVVIVGQDPYHGPGQAQGLAFSVGEGCRIPPSLRNIYKEIASEGLGEPGPSGDLTHWARQGVLLINTVLTVEDGKPGSHARKGWEALTDMVIARAARDPSPKAFMLWGAHAWAKESLPGMDSPGNLVLKSSHPSPLSARRTDTPFLGCGHFVSANKWLADHGRTPVRWGRRA